MKPMIMKITKLGCFEYFYGNNSVSIGIDTIIMEDAKEISRNRVRRAFVPGEIEQVKQYIEVENCDEINFLEMKWTIQVINQYKKHVLEGKVI